MYIKQKYPKDVLKGFKSYKLLKSTKIISMFI